jgi:beta-N-acetylhexosaminidase
MRMVDQMSLDDKLGQMLMLEFYQSAYAPTEQQLVESVHPGGVVVYGNALGTAQQLKTLLADGQRDSATSMFTFATDAGGSADQLGKYFGFGPPPAALTATGNPGSAQGQGARAGANLLSLGYNVDLAPNLNLPAGLFDTRSFGATAEKITTYGGAWLMGLQSTGALGCAIDFPSYTSKVELAPYRALIQSGQLQMIMIFTGVIPSVDPALPAALSKPTVTGLLRNELQFSGVVITDTLFLSSVSKRFSLSQAAVMAVEAGVDMIDGVWDTASAHDVISALKAAIASGALSEQQVDAAVTRILALKLRYHIITAPSVSQ